MLGLFRMLLFLLLVGLVMFGHSSHNYRPFETKRKTDSFFPLFATKRTLHF